MDALTRLSSVVFLSAVLAGCATTSRPAYDTLIAHGGESLDAPENTLPAYRLAVERGFGFECDLHLSSDGRVVVGAHPAPLEDVLALARNGRRIYLVVKSGAEIAPVLKSALSSQSAATPRNVLFVSSDKAVCVAIKDALPEYTVYLLSSLGEGVAAQSLAQAAREARAEGVYVRFDPDVVNEEFVAAVKSDGLSFHVWTLDNLSLVLRAFAVGADTVTANGAKQMFDEYCALYAPEQRSGAEFDERIPDGAAYPSAQVHGF